MKNVGVPATPLASALATSSLTRSRWARWWMSSVKRWTSRPSSCAWLPELEAAQVVLVREQPVVHLPERALRRRRLRRLGRHLGVRVDVGERKVPPDVAQLVAERVEQLADDDLRLPAVRALVVAVLDERDGRGLRAADVVALGIDVVGEVEQRVRGAADLARPDRLGQPRERPEDGPAHERREDRGAEHAELRLVERLPFEGDRRDQERDGEPDAGDRSAADDHRPAHGRSQPAQPRPRPEP